VVRKAVIGLAQPVVASRDIFGPESIFPEIESALAFGTLQAPCPSRKPVTFEHFARRPFDRLDDVVRPRKAPTRLGERVDPRHALPAAVAGRASAATRTRASAWTAARAPAWMRVVRGRRRRSYSSSAPGTSSCRRYNHARQRPGILDALSGARRKECYHRMRGVARAA